MKKFCFGLFFVGLVILSGCENWSYENREEVMAGGEYDSLRINADTNLYTSNEDYFYQFSRTIYRYSFQEQTLDKIVQLQDGYIYQYAVYGDYVFYVKKNRKTRTEEVYQLIKYDYRNGGEEILLETDRPLSFGIYGGYLFYETNYKMDWFNPFARFCPIDGNIEKDSIDINTLFEEDEMSGERQVISYHGLLIERFFDTENGRYLITCIREKETDREILCYCDEYHMAGYIVTPDLTYGKTGDTHMQRISCLADGKYDGSRLWEENLVWEDGKIVGILGVSPRWERVRAESDVLFQLVPETGESKILYDTAGRSERIIGYKEGHIYLAENYHIYEKQLEGEETRELFGLPEGKDYIFDWQGNYLIVRLGGATGREKIVKVYWLGE